MNCLPYLASYSILYPGAGSLLKPNILANRSKQFPTAISSVSPNIRYLSLNLKPFLAISYYLSVTARHIKNCRIFQICAHSPHFNMSNAVIYGYYGNLM